MSLKDKIEAVRDNFRAALDKFPTDPIKIEELRVRFLGRKGEVAQLFSTMGSILLEERAEACKLLNELKMTDESKSYNIILNRIIRLVKRILGDNFDEFIAKNGTLKISEEKTHLSLGLSFEILDIENGRLKNKILAEKNKIFSEKTEII